MLSTYDCRNHSKRILNKLNCCHREENRVLTKKNRDQFYDHQYDLTTVKISADGYLFSSYYILTKPKL